MFVRRCGVVFNRALEKRVSELAGAVSGLRELLQALGQQVAALEARRIDVSAEVLGPFKVRMAELEDMVEAHLTESRRLRNAAAAHASRAAGKAPTPGTPEPEPEPAPEPAQPEPEPAHAHNDALRAIEARLRVAR